MKIADVKESKPENDYQAEEDARTMMKCEEIKADPERMKKCMALMGKQKKHISSIEDLHKAADDHFAMKRKEKMGKMEMEDED